MADRILIVRLGAIGDALRLLPAVRRLRIERPNAMRHGVLPFGVAVIDQALPEGGLALGALHEILGAGPDEEDAAVLLVLAPTLRRVGGGQGGDVARHQFAVVAGGHAEAVEVAAVLRRQGGDERRPPARHETVDIAPSAQAGKARVDDPQLVAGPRNLMNPDVPGHVTGAGEEAGVVPPGRLDTRGDVGSVA